jgi:hypothetical protein
MLVEHKAESQGLQNKFRVILVGKKNYFARHSLTSFTAKSCDHKAHGRINTNKIHFRTDFFLKKIAMKKLFIKIKRLSVSHCLKPSKEILLELLNIFIKVSY